ncbi:RB1-inducible coiled-coil protein 1 [Schistosoma japonicum]|nr:RB1-inducible coiled-coil protein 1 [Schistosoma japonicum]
MMVRQSSFICLLFSWLQNFQSELNRLDAIIQHCLRRMCRVTTTGTLISQLCEGRSTYARCLAEIVRRTEFDDMLTQRSVCYLKEETNLRTEECRRRRVFSKHLKNNVLHSLFSPWTNPKTECLGLANIPATISMSQDVDQQSSEISTSTNAPTSSTTTATTTTNRKLDSPSHGPTATSELTVNRRYAVSSLSEPRLNELAKACALNRVQHSRVRTTRLNSLSSPDPQLTKVKEDEMIESGQSNKRTETGFSTHQLQPVQLRQQHTRPTLDTNRRASMPFYESDRGDTVGVSNWSIDSSLLGVLSNNFYPTTQPVKITRDDLEKLMQSMPVNVCNLLRTELNKSFSLMKSASFIPNSSLIGYGSDHTSSGVCSGPSSIPLMERTNLKTTTISGTQIYPPETKSITTSPFCSVENIPSTRALIDVACQADFSLIEPIINVGSGRSLNSSLGLSVDDSVRHATTPTVNNHIGWDEPPGSLCSWELCRFPVIVRSRDRMSISLDTLPRFEHLITTGTQTEEQQLLESLESDCMPNKPTHATELDLQKTVKSDESSKSHEIDKDEGYYQHSQSLLSTFNDQQDPSFLPPITNEEIQDDNIIVSSIFAEENMFTDSALMMTSSFHSTKTTFSNNTNNNDTSSSHHTALISINDRSRSMSSSNLCDLTNAGDGGVDCENIKTSQEVLLPHSSSLPEEQLHNEPVERKNQATSFALLNNNCFKCRLERIRQDYFHLLQESLESMNNNHNNSIADHQQQLQRSNSETVDNKQPITMIANKQPSTSLDALQLKHLFTVLESYSLLFLKSDHICGYHPPVDTFLPTTTTSSELSSPNDFNTSNINAHSDLCLTACMKETTDYSFDPTVKECISNEITYNVDNTSTDQLDFEKSLQYLMDTLQLNKNRVSSCSVSTSTSLLASQIRATGESMLTQSETTSTVDMATSTTTLPKALITSPSAITLMLNGDCQFVFLPDDIVIFVPVPGAKQSASSNNFPTAITPTSTTTITTATTASTASCMLSHDVVKADNSDRDNDNTNSSHDPTIITKSDIWSMSSKLSSNFLEVISPSSSLLSSMIVQSSLPFCSSLFMNSSGGGSGTTTSTVTTVNNNSCATIRNSTALANELCTSTLGGNYGTVLPSTTTALPNSESDKNSLATTESCSTIPSASTVNYIQWRMLSSDGHVYFLHQDDFKALNIDDHIDYCKPMNSNIQETNSSQYRNMSFKEAFPAHNYFVAARYKSRERCLSKRANNRFNLPKNFIFYRVRARPLNIPQQSPSSHHINGSIKNSVIHDSCQFLPQSDTDVRKNKNVN